MLLASFLLISYAQQQDILAPGYGELGFQAPRAGSYQLPPLGSAQDGEIILTTGETTSLHTLYNNKITLLSFIYASCHDVNGCPLAGHVLQKTLIEIQQDTEIASALRVISLSFDPRNDTPEQLRSYARMFQTTSADWLFATTASEQQLQPILQAYGQNRIAELDEQGNATASYAHNLRVILIDRSQQIRNIYPVGFLHPDILLNDIKTVLLEEQGKLNISNQIAIEADEELALIEGSGDYKAGYETFDYTTRSTTLQRRQGESIDLMAFVSKPPLGLPAVPIPENNPITATKVQLGRKLFYDRRLSINDTLSCAMCHIPEQGFAHNEMAMAVGFEGRTVRRNAPTLYNVAYFKRLFHDGRETSLEQQVWLPLLASNEMANPSIGALLEKINHIPEYEGAFENAFAGRRASMETLGMALASYMRTLNAADSPFDRWYYAGEADALSVEAQRGYELFTGKAGCASCHTINKEFALFTDNRLHNTGIGWVASMQKEPPSRTVQLAPGVFVDVESELINSTSEVPPSDLGLYEVTQNPADRWRYKTPSLRNVALTAPYMHNGSMTTLEEVIDYYNQGGFAHELLDPRIRRLNFNSQEKTDLLAFLNSLTGSNVPLLVADGFAAPVGNLTAEDPHWSHQNRIEY